jgi:hypothetical protein
VTKEAADKDLKPWERTFLRLIKKARAETERKGR